MRVHEAILRGLQSAGTDAASGGADQETASPRCGLKPSGKIHIYVSETFTTDGPSIENGRGSRIDVSDPTDIARVVGATADATRLIGGDPIGSNDRRSVIPRSRNNRDRTTFVQRIYPLANILITFFAWGVSHA